MEAGSRDPGRRRTLYGRRHGKTLRPGRRQLLDEMLPRLSITLPEQGLLDPQTLFPQNPTQIWLEIGFGNGEHMAELAAKHPEVGYIGCEPFVNGLSAGLKELAARNVNNVRLLGEDARELLDCLKPASIDRVYLLFPDPWPKLRHHRRRFLSLEMLSILAQALRPGGLLYVASDHRELARWMLLNILRHGAYRWLAECADDWRIRPEDEPMTRYEGKALSRGEMCHYFRFQR